jgi:hypothetical protein
VVLVVIAKTVQQMRPQYLANAMESDVHLGVNVKATNKVIRHACRVIAPLTHNVQLQLFHQSIDVLKYYVNATFNANLIYAKMVYASLRYLTIR